METFYQGKLLREGVTTGSCAAAAAKAAVLALLSGACPEKAVVTTAAGPREIAVHTGRADGAGYLCSVIKDAGDDPDVTDGLEICARVELTAEEGVVIDGGEGVGRVTRKGLKTPVGSAAINPVPLQMIESEVRSVLPQGRGVRIIISVPRGAEIAAKTFNPRLGIVGGISILGTSGIVRPMSEEAYKESLALELDLLAGQSDICAFSFGEQGRQLAIACGVPEERCLVTSNFLGYMLDYASYRGVRSILLVGQIGKLCKVAAGVFQTHSRTADARMETLAAFAAMEGASADTVRQIYSCLTTAQAVELLDREGLTAVYQGLADRVKERAEQYEYGALRIEVMLYTDSGELLAETAGASEIRNKLQKKDDCIG